VSAVVLLEANRFSFSIVVSVVVGFGLYSVVVGSVGWGWGWWGWAGEEEACSCWG